MELVMMSLGGSLIAVFVQLSEFISRTVLAAVHNMLVFAGRAGTRREPTRAGCKTLLVVAATALLCVLSPVRAAGSELSARLGGSREASGGGRSQETETPTVSLTQSPLVMRMGKDEFRVAFGINSVGCTKVGCYGAIHYRVNWKAEDGTTRSEVREVGYTVVPDAARTITVDRQYFDTAEGAHTTDVVDVTVARITCHRGSEGRILSADRTDPAQLHGRGYRGAAEDNSKVVEIPQQQ